MVEPRSPLKGAIKLEVGGGGEGSKHRVYTRLTDTNYTDVTRNTVLS